MFLFRTLLVVHVNGTVLSCERSAVQTQLSCGLASVRRDLRKAMESEKEATNPLPSPLRARSGNNSQRRGGTGPVIQGASDTYVWIRGSPYLNRLSGCKAFGMEVFRLVMEECTCLSKSAKHSSMLNIQNSKAKAR